MKKFLLYYICLEEQTAFIKFFENHYFISSINIKAIDELLKYNDFDSEGTNYTYKITEYVWNRKFYNCNMSNLHTFYC